MIDSTEEFKVIAARSSSGPGWYKAVVLLGCRKTCQVFATMFFDTKPIRRDSITRVGVEWLTATMNADGRKAAARCTIKKFKEDKNDTPQTVSNN